MVTRISRSLSLPVLLLSMLGLITVAVPAPERQMAKMKKATFSKNVNSNGDISLPKDFRLTMVHLGSFFLPTGDASGFHDVYTERASAESYLKTGKFPDGATIVKELRAADKADFTTGDGVSSANSTLKQWFVMVKDSKGRFSNRKSWGKGWGWALFKPNAGTMSVSHDFRADCLNCHLPAAKTDFVYVQGYPTLFKHPSVR